MTSQEFKKIKLPEKPGVYLFTKGSAILYIGKASSLKTRVSSYFSNDLLKTRSPIIEDMVFKSKSISFITTNSVLEALILESNLIKKYKPIFNTKLKDDKSFNFVIFTNEKFPAVLKVRGKDLRESRVISGTPLKIFGPFPNGGELTEALKIIRKIIPFRDDKCKPGKGDPRKIATLTRDEPRKIATLTRGEPCFNYQLGLCPGVCVQKITEGEYRVLLKKIEMIFEGKIEQLTFSLEKEMRALAKNKKFELAGKIRDQIFALKHIKDVSLIKNDNSLDFDSETKFKRIEVYDIAHLSGSEGRGGMVVFEDGEPNRNEYRLFKISIGAGRDDLMALREILSRRLVHLDWGLPDLIVVDGGENQLKVAETAVLLSSLKIPVISVVKNDKHKPREILGEVKIDDVDKELIFRADEEAHRFVISKHRQAMRKRLV